MRALVLLILQVYTALGFFPRPPKTYNLKSDGGDPGEPLFLTPYIEAGKIEEARALARVTLPDLPDVESYSGFITVNKTYNSNQFFWYFRRLQRLETNKNIFLWLQGGPGASSMFGLFEENGPIYVKKYLDGTMEILRRQYNWARRSDLIYIDNPVGAGFSFTNDTRGYCTDQTQIGDQLYSTLIQFFQLFPELQNNKFYITGESYAGKYIPALGRTIHYKNPSAKIKINLVGMFIGDGWCDPINQLVYHKLMEQLGFYPRYYIEKFKLIEWNIKYQIKQENWLEALKYYDYLLNEMHEKLPTMSFYNFLNVTSEEEPAFMSIINTSPFRKAIHVGNRTYQDGHKVFLGLREDLMKSVAPWIAELLNYYKVMFYNGQLDIRVAYPLTLDFLMKLDFPQRKEYLSLPRYIVLIKETFEDNYTQIGFTKGAGKMGEFVMSTAGHMVPMDQPLWTRYMLDLFIYPPWEPIRANDSELRYDVKLIAQKPILSKK